MWKISLEVSNDNLAKVLERLDDLEHKGLFKIGTVLDENEGEAL